jgi:hypothetical protein
MTDANVPSRFDTRQTATRQLGRIMDAGASRQLSQLPQFSGGFFAEMLE